MMEKQQQHTGTEKITVRFGPGLLQPSALSFSVLAVVWVLKSPIMWAEMHGYPCL